SAARSARSNSRPLTSTRRLTDASARLVSVEDNFDGSTPMGRFAIGILILIAELELERIKGGWAAVSEAVGRGVHISARPPTGYKRDKESRLLPDEPAASFVAEVFRKRAAGASWAELARFLEENKVYPPSGNKHWSKVGVAGLVKNPVYLGQARSGKVVKDDAHEPLVYPGRVRRRPIREEVVLQEARRLARIPGDAGRTCTLRRLWAQARDLRQHGSQERRALPDLPLHRPLCGRPLLGASERARRAP